MADVNTLTIEEIEAAAAADEILEINTETRVIDVPVNYEFGVFNDKDVKTIYFKVPKTYNAVNLNDFQIRMVYMNASNEGNEYIVTNRLVYGSYLYFTWLLGRDLFKGEGKVRFIVCMRKFNSDGTTNKEFNTTIARGTVLGGLEVDDPTDEKYNLVAEINSVEALLECEAIQETVEAKAAETDATYQRMQELSATFGSPLVAATAAEMINGSRVYVYVGNETGYTAGHWYYSDGSQWNDGGVYQSAGVALDTTLSVAGKAADAKATGDAITAEQTARTNADTALQTALQTAIDNEATARTNVVNDVKSDLSDLEAVVEALEPGLSDAAKQALVDCLDNLLWKDGSGSQYIEALKTALNMSSNPFESAAYEIGALGYLYDTVLDEGCVRFTELNTRARLTQPVPCTHGKLIAKTGYEINCYFLNSTEYGEFVTSSGVHYTGYTDLEYKASSLYQWGTEKEILAGTNYVILAVKKTSGDAFTQDEMASLYGTAFEYEDSNNSFVTAEYRFGGWGFTSTAQTSTGYVVNTNALENRGGSVIAIPTEGGRLVAKSGYKINAHCLTSNKMEDYSTSSGTTGGYVDVIYTDTSYYQWEDEKVFPAGTKYCCVSVKKDSNENFTQSEISQLYGTAFEFKEVSA